MIEMLPDRVNADPWLVHRGRFLDTRFLVESGTDGWLVSIHQGRIESIHKGPFVMPRWTFALRASPETWAEFRKPTPKPGFHDLMAMIKFRTLRLEGDQHPFMSNLLYFKDVMSLLRRTGE